MNWRNKQGKFTQLSRSLSLTLYEIMQIHILGGVEAAFVLLNGSLGFFRSYRCGCCVGRYVRGKDKRMGMRIYTLHIYIVCF
jgi:hypothetical protein